MVLIANLILNLARAITAVFDARDEGAKHAKVVHYPFGNVDGSWFAEAVDQVEKWTSENNQPEESDVMSFAVLWMTLDFWAVGDQIAQAVKTAEEMEEEINAIDLDFTDLGDLDGFDLDP